MRSTAGGMASRWFVGALATVMAVTIAPTPASAQAAPMAPLHSPSVTSAAIADSYIVVYKDEATAPAKDRTEARVRGRGGQLGHRYTAGLRGFSAKLSATALADVRRDPSVAFVEVDARVEVSAAGSWGQDRINQRNLPLNGDYRTNANGSGVHVYVVDSGIRTTHQEFGGRATFDQNFFPDGGSNDCLGHGTHVAGTIGGATVGVARAARLHAVRVFGCGRFTDNSIIVAAIDWVTANAQRPAVMNLSLGGGISAAVDNSVNAAINAGITVAIAAGNNNGNACDSSPARVPRAITVANSDRTDARYDDILQFASNWGPCVDLFAPGTDINSASAGSDTGLVLNTGTSMAAPHVAGVAAMYLQKHRGSTPQQVRDFIVRNATPNLVTGLNGSPNLLLNSTFDSPSDYNGDNTSDVAVWRPGNGTWFARGISTTQWGTAGDVPVPADYNGDGRTDLAVWRPSTGTWFVLGISTTQWGTAGDIPVPADYNGDGRTDLAVWRPSSGTWFVLGISITQWGTAGDVPMPADYDGNGTTDLAVWRPSSGTWFALGFWNIQWGTAGDVPRTGDFNGDGMADIAVWRPSDGNFFARLFFTVQWGQRGDIPV